MSLQLSNSFFACLTAQGADWFRSLFSRLFMRLIISRYLSPNQLASNLFSLIRW